MFWAFALAVAAALTRAPGDYGAALRDMGYSPSPLPVETVELTIPEEWGPVYERYNAVQLEGGFDLRPYKGRTCTRYTYLIDDLNARGNILVHNGVIIGGDVCSITLDGIMLPLEKDKISKHP